MNGAEDQAPSVRPRGTSQRRRARAATRFDPVVTQDKLDRNPRSANQCEHDRGLDRGISRGRTYRKKGKKARSRHTRWASAGTL